MKRYFPFALVLMILAGLTGSRVAAQTVSGQRALADIPFAFNVGKKSLPAGKYTVRIVNPSSDQKVIQINALDGGTSVLVQTIGVEVDADEDARLVFHRYGDRYFFNQVHLSGASTSLATVQSEAEKAERKALTRTKIKKSVVVVVFE